MSHKDKIILGVCGGIIVVLLIVSYFLLRKSPVYESAQRPGISPTRSPRQQLPYVKGQILVKFRSNVSAETIAVRLQGFNASVQSTIPELGTSIVSVPPGKEEFVTSQLMNDPIVEYAEPDYIQHVNLTPNDPSFNVQWGLNNTGQTIEGRKGTVNADISIEQAWDVSTGQGVKVGVVDSGVDTTHPDLSGKIIAQRVFVTNTIDDKLGHGTHVAGTIAALNNNGQGVTGVCPGCQLVIAKALDDEGNGSTAIIAQAIIWVADNGVKVINLSEGGNQNSQTQADAVAYAQGKGAVIVAAAGNDATTSFFYPAAIPSVLSVAATSNQDKKASFSNYGSWVDVAAPGQSIYSTVPTHAYNMQLDLPNAGLTYSYLSGTSMATPVVSGIAALVWTTSFGTSQAAVIERITSTADKIEGTGPYWQYGRVNAAKAVGYTEVVPTSTSAPSPTITPTVTLPPVTLSPTVGPTLIARPTFVCLDSGTCLSETPTATPTVNVEQPTLQPEQPPVTPPTTTPDASRGLLSFLISLILFFFRFLFSW